MYSTVCDMIAGNNNDESPIAAIFGPNSPNTAGVLKKSSRILLPLEFYLTTFFS